jgi:hypothetical protein
VLTNLLKFLLGSEPAIRLVCRTASDAERRELIQALNAGAQENLFNFRFKGHEFLVIQRGHDFNQPPAPTVEYDLDKYERKAL